MQHKEEWSWHPLGNKWISTYVLPYTSARSIREDGIQTVFLSP